MGRGSRSVSGAAVTLATGRVAYTRPLPFQSGVGMGFQECLMMGWVMATYVFKAELEEEEDGRWSSWIDVLPGCAAWGYTRDEALQALQDGTEIFVESMLDRGLTVPVEEIGDADGPTVAVTVLAVTI